MSGYYLIRRGLWNEEIFKKEKFTEREAYLWLYEHATYKTIMREFKGRTYKIQKGQYYGSITNVAETFGWSRDKLRSFIERMQFNSKLHRNYTPPFLLLTICNYGEISPPKKRKSTEHNTFSPNYISKGNNKNNNYLHYDVSEITKESKPRPQKHTDKSPPTKNTDTTEETKEEDNATSEDFESLIQSLRNTQNIAVATKLRQCEKS